MSEHRYTGMLGGVTEASDIHAENAGCTIDQAFEIQSHLAELRQQEYIEAITEIEESIPPTTVGNVVYGVPFGRG